MQGVERAGGSRARFLELAGIDPELVEQGKARLTVQDYMRALDAALEVSNDPALGLHLGEHASTTMYHVVAHVVEHASTLGEGVDTMLRYSGILATGYGPELVDYGDKVALRLAYLMGESIPVRFTAEFAMTGFMRFLRHFVGESARPDRACFAYRAPDHVAEYRRVFGGAECFAQPSTEMVFPREWLSRSRQFAMPELYSLLQTHAERELLALEQNTSTAARVLEVLERCRPSALPTMEDVARQLDISARTLARRLQVEQVTFAELVDRRRTSAAKSLLVARGLTIQQVATAMGFADAPAFHKAFRRWTGLTPKQYVSSVMR
jgi:AraC-like DNA-binding protein